MSRYIDMNAQTLANEITSGERNLKRIKLPEGSDMREYIPEINNYLSGQPFFAGRLDLSEAQLIRIIAPGINLSYADMSWANMLGADITQAYMTGANITGANLSNADIRKVIGLETIIGADTALLIGTIVNEREKAIMERILGPRILLNVQK